MLINIAENWGFVKDEPECTGIFRTNIYRIVTQKSEKLESENLSTLIYIDTQINLIINLILIVCIK